MNKYKTINGKIRHAHAPVGTRLAVKDTQRVMCFEAGESTETAAWYPDMDHCIDCGYHVCSCPSPPLEWDVSTTDECATGVAEIDDWVLVYRILWGSGVYYYTVSAPHSTLTRWEGRAPTLELAKESCIKLYKDLSAH